MKSFYFIRSVFFLPWLFFSNWSSMAVVTSNILDISLSDGVTNRILRSVSSCVIFDRLTQSLSTSFWNDIWTRYEINPDFERVFWQRVAFPRDAPSIWTSRYRRWQDWIWPEDNPLWRTLMRREALLPIVSLLYPWN